MANYITRVELHKADNRTVTADDYENLHSQMRAKGFKTTITSSEPKVYKLPTAEYDRQTTAVIATVLADAKAAATEVVRTSANVKSYSVIVSEYSNATWHNLEEVKMAAAR